MRHLPKNPFSVSFGRICSFPAIARSPLPPEAEQSPLRHWLWFLCKRAAPLHHLFASPPGPATFALSKQPAPSTGHPHHGLALGGGHSTHGMGQGGTTAVVSLGTQPLHVATPVLQPAVLEEPGLEQSVSPGHPSSPPGPPIRHPRVLEEPGLAHRPLTAPGALCCTSQQ